MPAINVKYSIKRVNTLLSALRMGAPRTQAALAAGIHRDTFRVWMRDKPDFAEKVEEAEAQRVVMWLTRIEQASQQGSWQAAAWKLERIYPDLFGRHLMEVSGRDGGPIEVQTDIRDRLATKLAATFDTEAEDDLAGEPE